MHTPDAKIFADIAYGMLAFRNCLLTKIAYTLQENSKKIYTVDRLPEHLL